VRTSKPYDVGTTTVQIPSRGRTLETTVAYPASSSGTGATAACGRFPLVVVAHGSQGTGASAAALHTYLVRSGYLLASPTFPSDITGAARDVGAVISRMRALSRHGGVPFAGRVRRGKVGFIGTSMGAMVGLSLFRSCCTDRRVHAVVAKLGTAIGSGYRWRSGPPLLMINGTADTTVPYDGAVATYRHAKRPKGLVSLAGIGHDLLTGSDPILTEASLGFYARYLRGKRGGLQRVARAAARSPIATLRSAW
jgi:fermentation-respiration switch protein FrsA (DUF1100 family)